MTQRFSGVAVARVAASVTPTPAAGVRCETRSTQHGFEVTTTTYRLW
jgi:hypothetical protein